MVGAVKCDGQSAGPGFGAAFSASGKRERGRGSARGIGRVLVACTAALLHYSFPGGHML